MFEGFRTADIKTDGATIHIRYAGVGPPLLLLHGYPQTHAMWHLIAPGLAEHFTVVAADLRGYGDSSKPPGDGGRLAYSKRVMAADQLTVMGALGFERFAVAAHDRGARCAYRMALDHPDRVSKLALLDILPTAEMFRRVDRDFALAAWHWFFLSQPFDLPERLLAADPENFYFTPEIEQAFVPEALAEYRRCLRDSRTIHAICEDYRAGAGIDCELDEADRERRQIECPVHVLWGTDGAVAYYEVLEIWRTWAKTVSGEALPCGHHLAEEAPNETLRSLVAFLATDPARRA